MSTFSKLIGMNGKKAGNDKFRSEYPNPSYDHILEGLALVNGDRSPKKNLFQLIEEGSALCDDAAGKRFFAFEKFHVLGHCTIVSHEDSWNVENGRQELMDAINAYEVEVDGERYRKLGGKQNWLQSGMFLYMLTLHYGEVETTKVWKEKAVASWSLTGVADSRRYNKEDTIMAEVGDLTITALPVLILIGKESWAAELLKSIGFSWDDVGFDAWFPLVERHTESLGTFPKDTWYTLYRLILILSSPDGSISIIDIKNWLPTPSELGNLNKAWLTCTLGMCSLLNLGARVYEKIGDDDNAVATANLGVSEQKKKAVSSDCRCLLGRVAARKGDSGEATNQFRMACEEAHEARVYVIEIIAAREWKKLYPDNPDSDAFIKRACLAIEKPEEQINNLLC